MNLHVPQWERLGPDTNAKTDNQADGKTDGQGDSHVVYTPKLCQWGIIIKCCYITVLFWRDVYL